MQAILTVLLPLFIVILVGFVASYSDRFARAESSINALVFNVALPALLFMAVLDGTPLDSFPAQYPFLIILTLVATSLILFGFIFFAGKRTARVAAQVAMGGAYGNVVYFAIPIAMGLFGPIAGVTVGIGQMVHNLLYMIFYPVVVSVLPDGNRVSFWQITKKAVLFNPVAMSIVLGLAYGYSGLPMPTLVADPLNLLGQIATPGALFCIGLTFRQSFRAFTSGSVKTLDLTVSVIGKLVLLPLITIFVVRVVFPGMSEVWASSMILMAAMPTSTTAYLASVEYDDDANLLAATVVATSLCSVITIPIFLLML
ncbi:AEC family transporter [Leucobacter sp. UCMA 4100]|uniref:AEC family transporter n=1 Tax=Leucobacter sp. UCMA 4100 TaxID=2810534 RepID=UPI0022EA97AD|nr:AEC family transporter [Leucobacter sp. UCMA 4100]MDA3146390.1 AEC family transporter [Leucobacter sp. UCMA 4100]